jgi:hypothetical protein
MYTSQVHSQLVLKESQVRRKELLFDPVAIVAVIHLGVK